MVEGDGLENRSAKAPGVRIPPPPPESACPFASGLIPILIATLPWAGCDRTEACVSGVDQAGRYKIDVVERYDEQSRFAYDPMIGILRPGWTQGRCMAADGIGAGASVVLAGTGVFERRAGSCNSVTADLSPPPAGITVAGPATQSRRPGDPEGVRFGDVLHGRTAPSATALGRLALPFCPATDRRTSSRRLWQGTTRRRCCSRCSSRQIRRTSPVRPATTTWSLGSRSVRLPRAHRTRPGRATRAARTGRARRRAPRPSRAISPIVRVAVDRVEQPLLLRVDRQVDVGVGVGPVDQHRRRAGRQPLLARRSCPASGSARSSSHASPAKLTLSRGRPRPSSRYATTLWRTIVPRKQLDGGVLLGRRQAARAAPPAGGAPSRRSAGCTAPAAPSGRTSGPPPSSNSNSCGTE